MLTYEKPGKFTAAIAIAPDEFPPPTPPKMEDRVFEGRLLGWPFVYNNTTLHDYHRENINWIKLAANILLAVLFSGLITLLARVSFRGRDSTHRENGD